MRDKKISTSRSVPYLVVSFLSEDISIEISHQSARVLSEDEEAVKDLSGTVAVDPADELSAHERMRGGGLHQIEANVTSLQRNRVEDGRPRLSNSTHLSRRMPRMSRAKPRQR